MTVAINQVFKALSDPTRRRILELLHAGPLTAGELSDAFPLSKPTMSAHFATLQQAGLVEAERSGRSVVYRLKLSVLEDALLTFSKAFGRDSEAGAAAGNRPAGRGQRLRHRET